MRQSYGETVTHLLLVCNANREVLISQLALTNIKDAEASAVEQVTRHKCRNSIFLVIMHVLFINSVVRSAHSFYHLDIANIILIKCIAASLSVFAAIACNKRIRSLVSVNVS